MILMTELIVMMLVVIVLMISVIADRLGIIG